MSDPTLTIPIVEADGSVQDALDTVAGYINPAVLGLLFAGEGTPEGAVTAPVGALFLRRDGGAGTALYAKESGTGNTGWAAK
jgi:hypothetical protein